jgi:hypothetical protein
MSFIPPRLVLIAPEAIIARIEAGGVLRLAHFAHVSWDFGGAALVTIARSRPDLIESIVAPFEQAIADGLSAYDRDSTGPAELFVRVVIEQAPIAWAKILKRCKSDVLEKSLTACLGKDADHRRTASWIIESAVGIDGPVGDIAKRLRARFPKVSLAPAEFRFVSRRSRAARRSKKPR